MNQDSNNSKPLNIIVSRTIGSNVLSLIFAYRMRNRYLTTALIGAGIFGALSLIKVSLLLLWLAKAISMAVVGIYAGAAFKEEMDLRKVLKLLASEVESN